MKAFFGFCVLTVMCGAVGLIALGVANAILKAKDIKDEPEKFDRFEVVVGLTIGLAMAGLIYVLKAMMHGKIGGVPVMPKAA